jgi:hypothetical protein
MGIVFPSADIARRWDGALQARLRRAPLEKFLRARGVVPATAGAAQDTDNVARATVLIIDAGLARFCTQRSDGVIIPQRETIAHMACVVSCSLAELILEPRVWRIAALLSVARLLRPSMGLIEAALASGAYVRRFQLQASSVSSVDPQIAQTISAAVTNDALAAMTDISVLIAERLNYPSSAGRFSTVAMLTKLQALP